MVLSLLVLVWQIWQNLEFPINFYGDFIDFLSGLFLVELQPTFWDADTFRVANFQNFSNDGHFLASITTKLILRSNNTGYFVVLMRQVVYKTKADYEKTHDCLSKNPLVVTDITEKGLLWFKFKATKTIFMLSTKGTLQVKWNTDQEKQLLMKLVENLLIDSEGNKAAITPDKQQAWINYEEPFTLSWCEENIDYGPIQPGISPEMAGALVYYRILEKEYDCSAGKTLVDILEDLTRKYSRKK
jgi:hypothetical protein